MLYKHHFLFTTIAAVLMTSSAAIRGDNRPALPASTGASLTVQTWVYGSTPPTDPIQWISQRDDETNLGIKAIWSHQRGLRIQVRPGERRTGTVLVSLRFDIADESARKQRPVGVGELIERGLVPGGLGQATAAQVSAHFAGTSVRFLGVDVSDDAITYSASCKGEDLPRALELLRAYYGDPGWRPEAEPAIKHAWLHSLALQRHDVDAEVERRTETALAGEYSWRRPASPAEVKAIGFQDADAWLGKALNNDTLTVTIVGDAPASAADTAALWFGPYRVTAHFMMASTFDAHNSSLAAPSLVPGVDRFTVLGPVAKTVIHVVWPTDDIYDIHRARCLDLLAGCLESHLQSDSRHRFGIATSAKVWSFASSTFRGEGQINALMTVRPDQAKAALSLIMDEAAKEAMQGIDRYTLEAQRTSVIDTARQDKMSDQWWLDTVLRYAAWQPFRITWAADMDQEYRSISAQEVDAAAKQYLENAKAIAIVGTSYRGRN